MRSQTTHPLRRVGPAALVLCGATSLPACTAILGSFDFDGPAVGGGGTTSSGGGGNGGMTTTSMGGGGATTTSSGTGGMTGGGGTGGAPVCTQGQTQPCYTGPTGTEDKGICKGGVATCLPDGTGYGSCNGEITPAPAGEDCYKSGDEDCDGAACADAIWNIAFTDTNGESVTGLAVDAQGAAYLVGTFGYILTVGGESMTAAGGAFNDYYLAKFSNTGALVWLKQFGDAQDNGNFIKVAVDGSGDVVIGGELRGAADFGGGTLTSAGNADVFVAKLDSAGNHLWSKRFGSAAYQRAAHISADAQGNIFIAGDFLGSFGFGGTTGTLTNSTSNTHVFYASLDTAGNARWSKSLDDPGGFPAGSFTNAGIVPDPADPGHCFVAGRFNQGVNLGGTSFASSGNFDIYLGRLDANGGHVWSQQFGSTAADEISGLAASAAGDVAILGRHGGTINFGTGNLSLAMGPHYAAKFDKQGVPTWARAFGGAGAMFGGALAFGAQGDLFIVGGPTGDIDFGAGALLSGGGRDAAIAKLGSADGNVRWNKVFGGAQDQWTDVVAVSPSTGDVTIAGGLWGSINFGLNTLSGTANAFVATFQP